MSESGISANRLELLQIADAVARDKSIDKNIVISAMEDAIQKAAKTRYGSENEIRAEIDPKTGQTNLARLLEVVEVVENKATEIDLKQARKKNKEAEIGDFISEELPPLNLEELQPKVQNKLYFKRLEMLKETVNMMSLKIKLMRLYQESSRGSNTGMSLLILAETKQSSEEMSYYLEKALEVATEF